MAAARRKSEYTRDEPIAELTSGQLVAGICLLLVIVLLVFLLGIVVGNLDSTLQPDTAVAAQEPGAAETRPRPEGGVQTSPNPRTLPGTARSAAESSAAGTRTVEMAPPVRRTETPAQTPPPPPADNELAMMEAQRRAAEDAEPVALPPGPPPATTPLARAEPPRVDPPPAQPEPAPAAAPAAAPTGDIWSVQLVAYGVENRAIAEENQQRLKRNAGIDAELVPSADGKFLRLMIGAFNTREEADTLQEELRQRPGLADCIVRKR